MTRSVNIKPAGVEGPITLVNAISVPMSQGERFLQRWRANAQHMADAPGLIKARMMRAVHDEAEITFVNVADWASGPEFDAAHRNPGWLAAVQALLDDPQLDVVARPMAYQVQIEVTPGSKLL
ncbi:antibiotic biosynthesis monooxygenase family protein [Pseudonocardia sp. TRM90224]|uniref:antibiotic biosynthesis monooxygenase family protein n=1 Tax=Pseudonocardia sp. TRM90224 TaxID=2812678 RepID=UPI001E31E3D5|nr:antibiotic biosynthesis monooxygenase family protein [Pseudonocardia sp. TRM90224]